MKYFLHLRTDPDVFWADLSGSGFGADSFILTKAVLFDTFSEANQHCVNMGTDFYAIGVVTDKALFEARLKRLMKTIYQTKECIIICDDMSYQSESSDASRVTAYLRWENVANALEIWRYSYATKKFYAYKNKGLDEGVFRLAQLGINVIKSCVSMDAVTKELSFATDKDEFYFKLRF